MKLHEIFEKINRKEWVLPPFQREYVWNEEKRILDFIDSVFKGYPIGSIILWSPNPKDPAIINKIKKRQLKVKVEGEPIYLEEYIIDGQQRITTLMRFLNGEEFIFKGVKKKAYFNFLDKKFLFLEEDKENCIPVKDIFTLSNSQIKNRLNVADEDIIDDLMSKIRNTNNYPINIERTPSRMIIQEVQELFVRLNTGGKQLPSVDLALAYISLIWDESREEFNRFKQELASKNFEFDVDFFIRCLSAICLKQSITKKIIRSFAEINVIEEWEKARNAIEKTIDFLKSTYLNLDSNLFLEAENTLIPIVLLFGEKEEYIRNNMGLLAYWFVISYLSQRFSGQSTQVLNQDINTIIESNDPINGLLNNLRGDRKTIFTVKTEDIRGQQWKFILYLILRNNEAKDFISDFRIESSPFSAQNRLDFHHIFANKILKNGTVDKELREDISNKTFLTNKTNKVLNDSDPTYLSDYRKETLKAHLIPIDESLWKLEKYEEFLARRRELIKAATNNFLDSLKSET